MTHLSAADGTPQAGVAAGETAEKLKTMNSKTFNTAAEVFHDAEVEYGTAVAEVLLSGAGLSTTPLGKAKEELAVKSRALSGAAKFAANNRPKDDP